MDKGQRITLKVELLHTDSQAQLGSFIQLVHLGLFQEASHLYDNSLRHHYDNIFVFLEHAEMLLREGSYSELAKKLDQVRIGHCGKLSYADPTDINHLLTLMKTLAKMGLNEMTQDELDGAFGFWGYSAIIYVGNHNPSFTIFQVTAMEMFVRIVTIAESNHLSVPEEYTNPPHEKPGLPKWLGFCRWYASLRSAPPDLYRQAGRIQSILLPVIDDENAMAFFVTTDLFEIVANESKAEGLKELRLISLLATSNNICEYLLVKQPRLLSLAEAYLDASKFFKELLARKSKHAAIARGRPLLRVNELQELVSQRRSNHRSHLQ